MPEVMPISSSRSIKDKLGRAVLLRPYQEGDFKDLSKMYDEFEPKGRAMGLPPVREENRHEWMMGIVEEWFNIVAVLENRIVGHAALDKPVGRNTREFMIFVHQDYQNKGIGQALTSSIMDAARVMKVEKVWIVVENLNRIAITVFKKAGFSFVSDPDAERLMVARPQ